MNPKTPRPYDPDTAALIEYREKRNLVNNRINDLAKEADRLTEKILEVECRVKVRNLTARQRMCIKHLDMAEVGDEDLVTVTLNSGLYRSKTYSFTRLGEMVASAIKEGA